MNSRLLVWDWISRGLSSGRSQLAAAAPTLCCAAANCHSPSVVAHVIVCVAAVATGVQRDSGDDGVTNCGGRGDCKPLLSACRRAVNVCVLLCGGAVYRGNLRNCLLKVESALANATDIHIVCCVCRQKQSDLADSPFAVRSLTKSLCTLLKTISCSWVCNSRWMAKNNWLVVVALECQEPAAIKSVQTSSTSGCKRQSSMIVEASIVQAWRSAARVVTTAAAATRGAAYLLALMIFDNDKRRTNQAQLSAHAPAPSKTKASRKKAAAHPAPSKQAEEEAPKKAAAQPPAAPAAVQAPKVEPPKVEPPKLEQPPPVPARRRAGEAGCPNCFTHLAFQ